MVVSVGTMPVLPVGGATRAGMAHRVEPVCDPWVGYLLVLGRPGGLISDLVTASSDRPQRLRTCA